MTTALETTEERYTLSRKWLARAERVNPGGHHLSGRVLTTLPRFPMYFEAAAAAGSPTPTGTSTWTT